MQKIITATEKEISVEWCGLSTIDFALRFEVANDMTLLEVLNIFMDPAETEVLIHSFDEHRTEYTGFTKFKGVDLKPSGSIVVALMEETA